MKQFQHIWTDSRQLVCVTSSDNKNKGLPSWFQNAPPPLPQCADCSQAQSRSVFHHVRLTGSMLYGMRCSSHYFIYLMLLKNVCILLQKLSIFLSYHIVLFFILCYDSGINCLIFKMESRVPDSYRTLLYWTPIWACHHGQTHNNIQAIK